MTFEIPEAIVWVGLVLWLVHLIVDIRLLYWKRRLAKLHEDRQ